MIDNFSIKYSHCEYSGLRSIIANSVRINYYLN